MNVDVRRFITEKVKTRADHFGTRLTDIKMEELSLVESGIFDSLAFFSLMSEIETEFGVELDLSESDPEYFTSFEGLIGITIQALQVGK